jgi:hypothetical protein
MESQTHRRDDKLKKSLFVAALLFSTAFGAEESSSGCLEWVAEAEGFMRDFQAEEGCGRRINAHNVIRLFSYARVLEDFSEHEEKAIEAFKFILSMKKDRENYDTCLPGCCLRLYILGEKDFAERALQELILDTSLSKMAQDNTVRYLKIIADSKTK